jgi:hypothetical protein
MSPPSASFVPPVSTKSATSLADHISRHPAGALLLAAGLGFGAVLVAKALMPPPRNRAMHSMEDILQRLKDLTPPVYDRVVALAEDGAHAVGHGMDSLGALRLDRKIDKAWRGFTGLFH